VAAAAAAVVGALGALVGSTKALPRREKVLFIFLDDVVFWLAFSFGIGSTNTYMVWKAFLGIIFYEGYYCYM
jgi:hypothetical protein